MKKNKIRQIIREQIQKLYEQSNPNASYDWWAPPYGPNYGAWEAAGIEITGVATGGIGGMMDSGLESCEQIYYGGILEGGDPIETAATFNWGSLNVPPNVPFNCVYFASSECQAGNNPNSGIGYIDIEAENLIDFVVSYMNQGELVPGTLSTIGCFGYYASVDVPVGDITEWIQDNPVDNFNSIAYWNTAFFDKYGIGFNGYNYVNTIFYTDGEPNRPPRPEFDCDEIPIPGGTGDLEAFAASLNLTVSVFCHDCLYVYDANILANVGDECGCCDGYRPPRPEEKYSFCCDQDAQNYGMDANGVSINGTVTWPIEGPGFGGNYVDTYLMLGGIPDNMAQCNNDICEYDDIDKEGCSEMIDDTHPLWPDCVKCWTNGFETSATGPDCECCRPMQKRYRCDKGWGAMAGNVECVTDPNGEFESLAACQEGCRGGDTHVLRPPRDGAGDDLVNLFQKRAGIKPRK